MTRAYPIRVRDHNVDATLVLPGESCVSILAAAQDHTESVYDLLQDASYYDETVSPRLLQERSTDPEADSQAVRFAVDLVDGRITFPGNVIDFSRRGVLAHRNTAGDLLKGDYRTYGVGRRFRLYDADRRMPIDEKASTRNEKSLWSNALPPSLENAGPYRLDGVDLNDENLRDLYVWTQVDDPRAPEVNGKSVYEIHLPGYRHVAAERAPGTPTPREDAGLGERRP